MVFKSPPAKKDWIRYGLKAAGFIVMAFALGTAMDMSASRSRPGSPDGFLWGMAHGALMPATLPSLVMGKDATIYARHNTGRTYNIGYTLGVNACGAVFFGLIFWPPRKKKLHAPGRRDQ